MSGLLTFALAAALGGCGDSPEAPSSDEPLERVERLADRIRERSDASARQHEERMAALLERAATREAESSDARRERRPGGPEAPSTVPVEPLPPFAWGDGFAALLAKLRAMPGVKEIRLRFPECRKPIDLDGATTRLELSVRFEEAFRSCEEEILRCIDTHESLSRRYFGSCDAALSATVTLAETPFALELGLVASAGALVDAERGALEAMRLEDNAGDYYLPLILRDLELRVAEPGAFEALQEFALELGRVYESGDDAGQRVRRGRYSVSVTDSDGRSANVELRELEAGRGRLRARFEDPQAGERAEERWRLYLAGRPSGASQTSEAREPAEPESRDRLGDI